MRNDRSIVAHPALQLSRWWRGLFAPAEPGGHGVEPAPRERILIVEDDLLIASEMEAALDEAGFDVVGIATNGEEAIEFVLSDPPALAVVDIRLAGDRDGVDTAIELFRSHDIRCVFASAHADSEARRRAEPAAPLGWLQKPYAMGSLIALVRKALGSMRDRKG